MDVVDSPYAAHHGQDLSIWLLPWDDVVFSYILPYLDLKSLFVLSGVCKDLRILVHTYFESMKCVDVGNVGSRLSVVAIKSLLDKVGMCQKFLLRNCKSSLIDSDLESALKRNNQVFYIDVTNCISLSNNALQTIAVSCSNLRTLILQNCVWVSSEAISNIALHCNHLEHVDLSGCWHVDDQAVTTVAMCCLRVKTLNLSRIYGITDKSIVPISQYSKEIQQLIIRDCWRVTDHSIWMLNEYCKKLKVLLVKGCRSVTMEMIGRFTQRGVVVDCVPPKPLVPKNGPTLQV